MRTGKRNITLQSSLGSEIFNSNNVNINNKYKNTFSSEPVKAKTSGLPQAQHRPALTEPDENVKRYLRVDIDQNKLT